MSALYKRFHKLLAYDPETGFLAWRGDHRGIPAGTRAGSGTQKGYRRICIDSVCYQEHRLIFFMVHKRWPAITDHKNNDRADNRIANLREATLSQNGHNRRQTRPHLKGTTFTNGKWRATLVVNGVAHYLGTYDTQQEAHDAYCEGAKRMCGEFARAS